VVVDTKHRPVKIPPEPNSLSPFGCVPGIGLIEKANSALFFGCFDGSLDGIIVRAGFCGDVGISTFFLFAVFRFAMFVAVVIVAFAMFVLIAVVVIFSVFVIIISMAFVVVIIVAMSVVVRMVDRAGQHLIAIAEVQRCTFGMLVQLFEEFFVRDREL
jgi:hypothetical protein